MIAVLSYLISNQFESSTGIKAVPLKPFDKLDAPVSPHADMLLCVLDKTVFCYEEYYQKNTDIFNTIEKEGYSIIKVKKECESKYPNDISLNVLKIKKMLFCNIKHTALEILNYAKENNYKVINVKQGYSACSTLILDDTSVITADEGMKSALEKECIRVHLISSSGIELTGYNCGFIGGSGVVIDNSAYFFGDVDKHPDASKIKSILRDKKIQIHKIISGDVCDFGGVKIL